MRLRKLSLTDSEINSLGLKEFDSNRLDSTLALVGKNGSGKTRFLKAIEKKLRNIDFVNLIEGDIDYLPSQIEQIVLSNIKHKSFFKALKKYKKIENEKNNNPKSREVLERFKVAQHSFNIEKNKYPFVQLEPINNTIQQHVTK